MAQKTFVDGDVLTASDLNTYCGGEGGAWTSWTPAVTQSGSVTVTNTRSRYARYGRLIIANFSLSVTGSGTGSNAVTVSIPATAAAAGMICGSAYLLDSSASNAIYSAQCYLSTTSVIQLFTTSTDAAAVALGAAGTPFTAGLASGDNLVGTLIYEAAS